MTPDQVIQIAMELSNGEPELCARITVVLDDLAQKDRAKASLLKRVIPLLEHVIEDDSPYTVSQSHDMIATIRHLLEQP